MSASDDDAIGTAIDRLAVRFPTLARDHIERIVREEQATLDTSRVRDFIPVLVERQASDRLRREADPVPPSTVGEQPVLTTVPEDLDPMEIEQRSQPPVGPLLGNSGAD